MLHPYSMFAPMFAPPWNFSPAGIQPTIPAASPAPPAPAAAAPAPLPSPVTPVEQQRPVVQQLDQLFATAQDDNLPHYPLDTRYQSYKPTVDRPKLNKFNGVYQKDVILDMTRWLEEIIKYSIMVNRPIWENVCYYCIDDAKVKCDALAATGMCDNASTVSQKFRDSFPAVMQEQQHTTLTMITSGALRQKTGESASTYLARFSEVIKASGVNQLDRIHIITVVTSMIGGLSEEMQHALSLEKTGEITKEFGITVDKAKEYIMQAEGALHRHQPMFQLLKQGNKTFHYFNSDRTVQPSAPAAALNVMPATNWDNPSGSRRPSSGSRRDSNRRDSNRSDRGPRDGRRDQSSDRGRGRSHDRDDRQNRNRDSSRDGSRSRSRDRYSDRNRGRSSSRDTSRSRSQSGSRGPSRDSSPYRTPPYKPDNYTRSNNYSSRSDRRGTFSRNRRDSTPARLFAVMSPDQYKPLSSTPPATRQYNRTFDSELVKSCYGDSGLSRFKALAPAGKCFFCVQPATDMTAHINSCNLSDFKIDEFTAPK